MSQDATIAALAALLHEARRLHNQTVRNSTEVEAWHRATDMALRRYYVAYDHNSAKDEYYAPERVAHREMIRGLFR